MTRLVRESEAGDDGEEDGEEGGQEEEAGCRGVTDRGDDVCDEGGGLSSVNIDQYLGHWTTREVRPGGNDGELSEGDVVTVVQVSEPSLVKHNLGRGDVWDSSSQVQREARPGYVPTAPTLTVLRRGWWRSSSTRSTTISADRERRDSRAFIVQIPGP